MPENNPIAIHLGDYKPTPYVIEHVEYDIKLHATNTIVKSRFGVSRRPGCHGPLVLDGEGLSLLSVSINDVASSAFTYENNQLIIHQLPDLVREIQIVQSCNPEANTVLSGLYLSNGIFCTQMEAQGFRRFAFFYDRPDVMATYRVRIEAPKSLPVLLSNGNPVEAGDVADTDCHYAIWEDPHPKPSYLFALVGGDLASVHDQFCTSEGRKVQLGIYVEKGKEDRCDWAMQSLKLSMQWDEQRFGRAYDLDYFNIVAVSDFNMGAMENKGLNVFNDKYILARADTATDTDFVNIERIIAHEYFHNWTGNRITCRDWFQLCLKEGLTVFRDQEFTSDVRSRVVKRIEDVKTLRARQFPEDQGPLAHPVRPTSYIEINNFYTPTVYEKGAELCRMMLTLIGTEAFERAMDLYFVRHDGDAATVEDFIACMAEASGRDLAHFSKWYDQAGTPIVRVSSSYNSNNKTFSVVLQQSTPDTPGQFNKAPLHIPLVIGLVDDAGQDISLQLQGTGLVQGGLLELVTEKQSYRFTNIAHRPRISINRGFSAPVIVQGDSTRDDLLFLMGHDSDSFNRWEAAQTLGRSLLMDHVSALKHKTTQPSATEFANGLALTLGDPSLDDDFKALMLQLPPQAEIAASIGVDVDAEHVEAARQTVRRQLAQSLHDELKHILHRSVETGPYRADPAGTARRSLRYTALGLLSQIDESFAVSIAHQDIAQANNMTSEYSAIAAVLNTSDASSILESFYKRHQQDHLLVDKWFMLQAQRSLPDSAVWVESLTRHPDFRFTTPNRVYALLGGFSGSNFAGFHASNGEGYRVLADSIIKLNGINPQVAARMATGFRSWKQFDHGRRQHAARNMQRILDMPGLCADVFEIISRTLG